MRTRLLLMLLLPLLSPAQSWQWGKRAGGSLGMNLGIGGVVFDTEQVKSMLTDAQGNVYFNGLVGPVSLDCDGIPLQGYSAAAGTSTKDQLIASFDCSGNFRWSKVIGGYTDDFLTRIQNDSQGNVYASGLVYRGENETIAAHFDTDTILPTTQADGIYKRGLYLIKYSADGEYRWLRMPQPENTTTAQNNILRNSPLEIVVDVSDGYLRVWNNIQLRISPMQSNKIGLKNILSKYRLMNQPEVHIENTGELFTVKVPLIQDEP